MFNLVNLIDFFHKGGVVLAFIFLASFLLWYFLLQRYIYIRFYFKNFKKDLLEQAENGDFDKKFNLHVKNYIISYARQNLKKNMSYISILIIITPLLGLLGTVTGMINIFDVLAYNGSSDIKLMTSGISMATIPTMAGMVVSLSGILFEKRIDSITKDYLHNLYVESSRILK